MDVSKKTDRDGGDAGLEPGISRRRLLQQGLALLAASGPILGGFPAARAGEEPNPPAPKEPNPPAPFPVKEGGAGEEQGENLVGLVNVMQGTDSNWGFSRGNTLPLIACPFGLTHWSPQNSVPDGWFFDPNAHRLQGIRATHQPSPWMGDYGNFTVMAQAGEAALTPEARSTPYRPEDLHTSPAYLSVICARDGVRLEVSPTERCAIFRVTVPGDAAGRVIFDADSHAEVDASRHTLSGFSRRKSGFIPDNFACYFYAEFDRPFAGAYPTRDGMPTETETVLDGKGIGVVAEFGPGPPVILRIGTSFISVEQAKQNLRAEIGDRSFEAVHTEAARIWNETLGVVNVRGGTDVQRRTFYSCLYRAHLFPRMFHEHDGDGKPIHYSAFDGKVHPGVMYTDTGLWDGYHTIYPLLSLIQPARLGEMVQGFVNAYQEGGWLPQWPHPGYHGGMGGTHSDVVLTDAILKNIPGFDREAAFAGMWKNATVPPEHTSEGRGGLADYLRLGYLPVGSAGAVVSNTLDFVYDDACIALAAAHLEHPEQQRTLEARARNYRRLYDPTVGFMRPRNADGTWQAKFDEFAWGDAYTEGGPWQWSLSVPHDPAGLIALMGGQAAFIGKLDRLLWQPPIFHPGGYGHEIHEMSEMAAVPFGQYDQGNQPAHQVLAHYVAAGCPARFQFWARRVLDRLYTPDQFPGDEDNGEMAAWYVLNALGLFPHCPGRPSYVFSSPLFPEVVLSPPGQTPLTLHAPATSESAVYVQSVRLNGRKQDRLWITHADLRRGGHLEFSMGKRPVSRRISPGDLPPSFSAYPPMAAQSDTLPLTIAINCGGAGIGRFVGDCFVTGGDSVQTETAPSGKALPDAVARSARRGTFAYRIPLPMPPGDGAYTLGLHFADASDPDQAMEVRINGVLRLSHFRPAAPVVKEWRNILPGSGGEILIEFSPSPGSPPSACRLSALEIVSA